MGRDIEFFKMFLGMGNYNVVRPNVHWIPHTDIYEFIDKFIIIVEIPGVDKNDVDITLKDGFLRISGVRKEIHNENRVKIHQMEISYGYFEKLVEVGDINEKNIKADLKDGLLVITIKKS
ncbi:MAG: Hsp20/alpha crystallin family protein [Brevinematales bacterium]|nr:Hsp20/alpha crystallin family protein [Brevinematales bacterium]